jgi:NlpC/P60 family
MKKLCIFFIPISILGLGRMASAQTSLNSVQYSSVIKNNAPDFIKGISFTPSVISGQTGGGENPDDKLIKTTVSEKKKPGITVRTKEKGSLIENLTSVQFKYAMMLGVEVESLKNLALFKFIDDWFGTRYHLGGDSKDGIDCSALTQDLLLTVYGLVVPRTARQQYRATVHVKRKNLREGDLVFFNTHGGVSHVGLYLDNDYFVHASTSQGVTISSLDDSYYKRHFICGGRIEHD